MVKIKLNPESFDDYNEETKTSNKANKMLFIVGPSSVSFEKACNLPRFFDYDKLQALFYDYINANPAPTRDTVQHAIQPACLVVIPFITGDFHWTDSGLRVPPGGHQFLQVGDSGRQVGVDAIGGELLLPGAVLGKYAVYSFHSFQFP